MFFKGRNLFTSISLCLILLLSACNDDNKLSVELDGSEQNIEISYFDQDFWELDSLNFHQSLQKLKSVSPDFFLNDQVSDKDWLLRYQDERIHEFSDSLFHVFQDSSIYMSEIQSGFKRFQYFFKDQHLPTLALWFSNFEMESPVVSSQRTIFIGQEHFLGPKHEFYKGVPDYIRFDKQLSFMGPKVFLEWSDRFNTTELIDQSFLSRIIFEGKQLYFAEQLLNLEEENRIIGYSKEDYTWSEKNEGSIWQFFINNDYLFSNDQKLLRRFVEPSPFSKFYTGNDNITPGRIGTYIGWKIIKSYMHHNPKISLSDLMKEKNAKKILNKSKYKPKI